MEIKIEINDALAAQAVSTFEKVAVKALENSGEMGRSFSLQSLLNILGNTLKPILEKELQTENGQKFAKMIMPILFRGVEHPQMPPQSKAPQEPEQPENEPETPENED